MGNVLITGANGFLGSHILKNFCSDNEFDVYCIIRGENEKIAEKKLEKSILHYFAEDLKLNFHFVNGDIGKEYFGLDKGEYEKLAESIDIVINSAGLTKHYGIYKEFYDANIKTIENLIFFSNQGKKKKLYHVSTMSVSGQFLCEDDIKDTKIFDEGSLDIGQDIEKNVYIKSKFVAEKKMQEYFENNGQGAILRVGNLTCRFCDGKKQIDVKNNAFTNRFIAFSNIGYIPKYLSDFNVEFSPVDFTAKAIYLIVKNEIELKTFHLYNDNFIKFHEVLSHLQILDEVDFMNKLKSDIGRVQRYLPYIINDLSDKKGGYKTNIINKNDISKSILEKFDFRWPDITEQYVSFFCETLKEEITVC